MPQITDRDVADFEQRFAKIPEAFRLKAMEIYANPVCNQLRSRDLRAIEKAV